ncbi:MAG: metal ABC transporter permease [Fibrobacter sp.]|nr:metal ABC transporter permease [Fibrobacter sp.]
MLDIIYNLLSFLPFEWARNESFVFMKHAFMALLFTMPVLGLVGTVVVEKRMAFFSDALGHGAFAGVAVGAVVGMSKPLLSALIFAVIFAVTVTGVSHRLRLSMDASIGALASFFMALGLFVATFGGGNLNALTNFLVGDILTVTVSDIAVVFLVFIFTILVWSLLYNPLTLSSVYKQIAISRGVRVLLLDMLFASLLAVIVTVGIQWLGMLTVNACLVLPATTARIWARQAKSYQWIATLLALVAGISGLLLSWYLGTLVGATSVLVLSLFFAVSLLWQRK